MNASHGYIRKHSAHLPPSSFDWRYYRAVYYGGVFQGALQIILDDSKEPLIIKGVGIVDRNDPKLEIRPATLDDLAA